jgi:hypothetical protein
VKKYETHDQCFFYGAGGGGGGGFFLKPDEAKKKKKKDDAKGTKGFFSLKKWVQVDSS